MGESNAHRQVRDALAVIAPLIPDPWDIEILLTRMAAQRGRPVECAAWTFPESADALSGLWIPTTRADYIFYDAGASPGRREQIIGHELGHLLLDHTPRLAEAPDGLIAALTPSLSPELARRLLTTARTSERENDQAGTGLLAMTRTGSRQSDEAAAELFGTSLIRLATTKPPWQDATNSGN